MEQYNIIGAPDSIKVECDLKFPDEDDYVSHLSTLAGCYNQCLSGSPIDVYSELYVDGAVRLVRSLFEVVTEAYMLGIIPSGISCRYYFNSCVPKHIKLIEIGNL